MDMEKDGTQHTKKTQSVQETETQKSETLSTSTPGPETMEISVAEVEATSMKTHTGEGQRQTQASESQETSEGRITTVNETQTTKATEGQTTTTANTRAIPQSARYRRLVTSSSTALAHAVKSLTYKRVAACYPSIAKTPAGQEALREALKQICKAWTDSVQTEFDAIFDERHLPEKLAQLDQLVKDARLRMNSNTDLPIHVDRLTPDQIIKSHLRETKLARIKKLKQLAQTVKKENDEYRQKIKENNDQVHTSLDKLHKVTSDISKATAATQEMPERAELYESWKAL
ncbi:Nnf1-domain-containing protein [Yarrowia lipolytica]|uniref:Nnf1-domain-containing protein n=1 Tax=Yarrowia lipolytica TaxID=4952 RepID=A0A371C229_YARLL|nr:Nnf1-domain-containing protein [Yarrowia lipolytica]RDW31977.1 Nnf1-domain-containing protein [Yarrowia lipolytica]RDW38074.1 Nnf1-domain-containing protein [Yarrowia lipolytica]RDW44190.1 Nnf1-domain-containing protein [Yarrowia lipolytica]RDW50992.1 Nnf1-domain-containing protein [Yarrowia lipolytica]